MLQAIREKVTGWIAYGIIFLISIPFALWGLNSYFGHGALGPVATVNGEEITARRFDQEYTNYRQNLARLFGGAIPESFGSEAELRAQVLDQIIEQEALRQYIDSNRYRIGDDVLAGLIRTMPEFQRGGAFDSELYQNQLRSIGLTPAGFEQSLRLSGSVEQFQNAIRATAFVIPRTSKQFNDLQNQTRKLRSVTYRPDPSAIEISDSDIEQRYLQNTDRYQAPEQVRIDYIDLSLEAIKLSIEVDEEDVIARYQENLDQYTTPEFREASHILITVSEDVDEVAARARIDDIRARIVSGESFADLAREASQDPVSAAEGGSLGEVGKGDMVPTFEAALFALEVGELSQPVKTGFGWHLIEVQSVRGGESELFENVRDTLEDEIRSEQAEAQIYDLVESVANLAYEQPDSLDPVVEQLDVPLQTSGWFDRASGPGIAAENRVRTTAFSDEVLEQGLNSEAVELGNERVVFLRVRERKPARVRDLDEVRDQIRSELIREQLAQAGVVAGNQALEDLRNGETVEQLAERWGVQVSDHGFVGHNDTQVDTRVLFRGFSMPKPADGLEFDGVSSADGTYTVIELSAVLSSDDGLGNETGGQALQRALGGAEYLAALKYLGARADVVKTPLDELDFDDY